MGDSQRNFLIVSVIVLGLVILCGSAFWFTMNLTRSEMAEETAVPTATPDAYPGLLIVNVTQDGPAAAGGLQPSHIILEVDGTPVNTPDDLTPLLDAKSPGDSTNLIVLVDGEMQQTAVTHPDAPPYLGVELVENWSGATALLTPTPEATTPPSTPQAAPQFDLAIVGNVIPDTPAADAGLESGDVLTAVDDTVILTNAELVAEIAKRSPGDVITLTLRRGNDTLTRSIILTANPTTPEQGYLGVELVAPTTE